MNGFTILAIDPGRSSLGVAVLDDGALRYYAVKRLRVPGTTEDVRRAAIHVLNALLDKYEPTHLAIEQPLVVQQRSELLAHVIGAIKAAARRSGLSVSEYAPQTIRRYISMDGQPTKREVARQLAARYPELSRYLSVPGKWAEQYYERLFGAVAVGVLAFNTLMGQDAR
jgi:Holliday junction resolvasome RuvABC endonuclease subunit